MKKRICVLFAALAVLLIASGCGSQPSAGGGTGADGAERASSGGGGRGGKIVIYTSMYENVIASLKTALKTAFPDYDIQFVSGGTGLLQARIASEEAAERLGCDMLLIADPSYAIELKQKGMLHAYKARSAQDLAFDYDEDGCWYPVRVSNMVLAYNPARTPRASVPNSFRDFANDASARSMISMPSPHTSGTALAALSALKDRYGDGYFTALGRQQLQVNMVSGMAFDELEAGRYKVLMILEESALQRRRVNPAHLGIMYPEDGTVMIPSPIMTIADKWSANRNTRAAEAITEWFLGDEGQNAIVDGFMHSVRKDFPRIPEGSIPTSEIRANSIPVNWEHCLNQRDDIQYKFDEALAMRQY